MYSRGARVIFKGLNLTIKRGEVTALMGPSGTGKTTLLRLITRQLIPQQGAIYVDGVDIATLNQRKLYELRQRFGMLFQNGALLTDLSVFENVAFPLREHSNLPIRLIRHVVLTKLHAVGLRGSTDMMPAELSGGMANGTHDPAGKIGGYADSVPGTKDPAYAVTSGQPPQDFPRGQAGSLVERGPSFAPYQDKPPPRGKTDFSTEDSNRGNP